jgi:hypothetical protein
MTAAFHMCCEIRFRPRPAGCHHGAVTARREQMMRPDPGLLDVH